MKAADLKKETDEQLRLDLVETEKHLFKLRFQSATDKLSTPSEIKKAKRDIARIHTEQRRRELVAFAKLGGAELTKIADAAKVGNAVTGIPLLGKRKAKRIITRMNALTANLPAITPANSPASTPVNAAAPATKGK
jgi:large subunit ribosomal protein L29